MFGHPIFAVMLVLPIFVAGAFTGHLASLAVKPLPSLGELVLQLLLAAGTNAVVASVLAYILTRKKDWVFFDVGRMTCLVLVVVIYVAGAGAGVTMAMI